VRGNSEKRRGSKYGRHREYIILQFYIANFLKEESGLLF
jgi:hypothetical protein